VYPGTAGEVDVIDFFGRDEALAHLSFACAEMLSMRTPGKSKRVAALTQLLAGYLVEKYTDAAPEARLPRRSADPTASQSGGLRRSVGLVSLLVSTDCGGGQFESPGVNGTKIRTVWDGSSSRGDRRIQPRIDPWSSKIMRGTSMAIGFVPDGTAR
jgi:hypothetical protein